MLEETAKSTRFRKLLKQELNLWLKEGIIGEGPAREITLRYNLRDIEKRPGSLLIPAIYLIGAFLIGGGAASFVAAKWAVIPALVKVIILVGSMLASLISGSFFWKIKGSQKNLGHGLVVLSTLIFGASIFLLAQIYDVQLNSYTGFALMALGAAAIAYTYSSTPNLLIAAMASIIWFFGWIDNYQQPLIWYPLILTGLCLPFTLRRRCPYSFTILLLFGGIALVVNSFWESPTFWAGKLTAAGLGLLLYGLGVSFKKRTGYEYLSAPALKLGLLAILILAYILSFHDKTGPLTEKLLRSKGWIWTIPASLVFLGGGVAWFTWFKSARPVSRADLLELAWPAGVLCLVLGLFSGNSIALAVLANIAAIGIATTLIWSAVETVDRYPFWFGILIAVVIITSRFFEYEGHLLIKSAAFSICGLGLIYLGLKFEKYFSQRRLPDE